MTGVRPSSDATIRVENITVTRHERNNAERLILDNVSCIAEQARITTIVGPSGGGKSTLIRLINRLNDPTGGTIYLDGADITGLDPLKLRAQIAMVMQKPYMFEGTVLDNLRQPFRYRGTPLPDAQDPALLRSLELARLSPEMLSRDARTLSLGEQQRANLARALITGPRVLLLDEPTSALDRPTADHLAATFQSIRHEQRLTLLLVTHDLRLAETVSDYLYFLEGGRIREEGPSAELFLRPRSQELQRFLGLTEAEGSH